MGHLLQRLRGFVLSAIEVKELTGWDDQMVEDYLSLIDNIFEITAEVEKGSGSSIKSEQLIANNQAFISKLHSRVNAVDKQADDNADAIIDNLQLIASINAFVSKLHSRVNKFDAVIADNTQGSLNNTQLIAGIDALLQKTRSSQNNLNKVFDEQIGLRETAATGVVEGGAVTPNTATTIDVAFGDGEIVDGYTDRREPVRDNVSWLTVIGMTINMPDTIGVAIIYTDSTEVIQQQATTFTATDRRLKVQLAFIYYKNGAIDTIIQAGILSNEVGNTLYDWMAFTPASDRVQGMGVDDVAGNMEIWANSGELISPGAGIATLITNPNILAFTAIGSPTVAEPFDVLFADGSTHLAAQTTVPALYESAPGVATGLTGQRAVIHYVYRTVGNSLLLQLGNFEYSDGIDARDSLENDRGNFVPFVGAPTTLLSAQVYRDRTASDFSDNTKAGIVSLIGDGAGASGGVSITTFLQLSDVLETTYTGNQNKVTVVNVAETGEVFSDRLLEATSGLEVRGSVPTATPPTTEAVSTRIELFDSTGVNRVCRLGFGNLNLLQIRNDMRGGRVVIDALNAAGARTNILNGDPDGTTTVYDRNLAVFVTTTPALGGAFLTNNLTGSGNERIQTQSDYTNAIQQAVAW